MTVPFSRVIPILVALLLVPALQAEPAHAAHFQVTTTNDPAPGACTPDDCSLREAIIAANESSGPDTISLRPGTYVLTLGGGPDNDARVGDLDIFDPSGGGLSIFGASAASTIVDGQHLNRVFDICCQAHAVHIEGLTIQNGKAGSDDLGFYSHGHGAGVHNHAVLTLKDVTISGNTVETKASDSKTWGGGGLTNGCGRDQPNCDALHGHGRATLINVTISGNRVSNAGGGGGIENGGDLAGTNLTITNNAAPAG
jgi:CSLREA domain-containing protein